MASITIKNIPDALLKDLKKRAKDNQRSINGEIIIAIRGYLNSLSRPNAEEIIKAARDFRSRVRGKITPEEIRAAINEGRS